MATPILPQDSNDDPEARYLAENKGKIERAQALSPDLLYELFDDALETIHAWLEQSGAPESVRWLIDDIPTLYAAHMCASVEKPFEGAYAVMLAEALEQLAVTNKQVQLETSALVVAQHGRQS